MGQRFYANPKLKTEWPNGAVGFSPGSLMDCIGAFAKVANCPIVGTDLRLTCYATNYADTFFSVPACTRHRGKHIRGFFTASEQGPTFHAYTSHHKYLPMKEEA